MEHSMLFIIDHFGLVLLAIEQWGSYGKSGKALNAHCREFIFTFVPAIFGWRSRHKIFV